MNQFKGALPSISIKSVQGSNFLSHYNYQIVQQINKSKGCPVVLNQKNNIFIFTTLPRKSEEVMLHRRGPLIVKIINLEHNFSSLLK